MVISRSREPTIDWRASAYDNVKLARQPIAIRSVNHFRLFEDDRRRCPDTTSGDAPPADRGNEEGGRTMGFKIWMATSLVIPVRIFTGFHRLRMGRCAATALKSMRGCSVSQNDLRDAS